ncbi:GAF and ANTAR domain-containing protein [Nocardia asteroides]|uniref:GAF and ANTAR domain-containing protein n=1 Tax=Nocardia asteroides TaxID=1824 RepID=UPI001E354CB9|nr:GAF and ANTAR domain-containing protein [Nocardia asteroides]UGT62571.1 GAF and ANTAR domain-containing protein [Nocardia asteroides]
MSAEDSKSGGLGDTTAAEQIVAAFARMAGMFLTHRTVDEALATITELAVQTVPGTAGAGITLFDSAGERGTTAATSDLVERADALQYELGDGPCLTASAERIVVRVDDVGTDPRWPRWGPRAAALGLVSTLSAPLVAGERGLGAMKVYGTDAYGPREEHVLTLFAAQASLLVAQVVGAAEAETVSGRITDKLRGRELIARATGFLMGRDGVGEQAAFLTLAHTAREQRISMRRVAEQLTAARDDEQW